MNITRFYSLILQNKLIGSIYYDKIIFLLYTYLFYEIGLT